MDMQITGFIGVGVNKTLGDAIGMQCASKIS